MARIAVITPATGHIGLRQCVLSVAAQTYRDVEHIVVIDGAKRSTAVRQRLSDLECRLKIIELPEVTGFDNYKGHRIYGAVPFLINADWVVFLDEDNWLDRDHIESLFRLVETCKLHWAYSLRKIMTSGGKYICNDDCQSLGWWPAYDAGYNLVDTSCYFIRRDIAVETSRLWHRKAWQPSQTSPDRAVCSHLLTHYPHAFTTGKHTLNYRLGGKVDESNARFFFENGNRITATFYKRMPWKEMQVARRLRNHPSMGWEMAKKNRWQRDIYGKSRWRISPLIDRE